MAVMGLRLAGRANGVAALHGAVSREMFQGVWPDVPVDEVPIGSITNGVHAHTWVSAEIDRLLARSVRGDVGRRRRGSVGAASTDLTTSARVAGAPAQRPRRRWSSSCAAASATRCSTRTR